jgi:hypothetical protein
MVETFYIRKKDNTPQAMAAIRKLHEEFLAEHQCEGPDAFMSYIAGEETANGVPKHGLSAEDVENINDHLELLDGDMVIMREFKHGPLSVSQILFFFFLLLLQRLNNRLGWQHEAWTIEAGFDQQSRRNGHH